MGRRLRTTLPSLSTNLQPELITRDCVESKDSQRKSVQEFDYNRRQSARSLQELRPGDIVLVWDPDQKEWKDQGRVQMKVDERSYQVMLQRGGMIRRNRHQLKPCRTGSQGHSQVRDWEDDIEDTQEPGPIQVEDAQESAQRHEEPTAGVTTRSGRVVKPPVWRQDYV